MKVEQLLEHHGVRGMKWGIRNDKGHEGEQAKTKKIDKLDKKFARSASSFDTAVKINNAAAKVSNARDVPRINNKPEYKGQDFSRDSPLRQKYYAEHQASFVDNLEKAAADLGTNASGTKKYAILEAPNGQSWDVYLKDVKHANAIEATIKLSFDAKGYITSLKAVPPIAHAQIAFLEHYGVRGMHWGIRNKRKRPSSSESKKAQALKKRKPHELTNKQLQTINSRQKLESTYMKANPGRAARGHAYVKGVLAVATTIGSVAALSQTPLGKAGTKAILNTPAAKKLASRGAKYLASAQARATLIKAAHAAKAAASAPRPPIIPMF